MRLTFVVRNTLFLVLRALTAMILAGIGAASAANAQGAGYWHTGGAQIFDSNNQPVRIAGINWYGFETTDLVLHGLSNQDYKTILQTIKNEGYNTIRIPFSNQMVETPGSNLNITYWANFGPANTDLQGLNSLQVLDHVIAYAGTIGLKVILDNHRSEAGNSAEPNGLWYTGAYPETSWIADWQALAYRYLGNPTVIGFDLRNEPHNAYSGGACWDCGGANDWHLAAGRAGSAVQSINPNLLLFIEGTDTYNNDFYWWGGNLEGVANSPVSLPISNQLVYSAHDYGPNEYQQAWFNGSTTPASLGSIWTTHWAYISQQGIAPVWLGEFGTENSDFDVLGSASGSQGQWFQSLTTFLKTNAALSWTYWALNGEDSYGLLDYAYDATPVNALKQTTLASIQFPLNTGSTSTAAPSAPSALTATASSASQINLSWTASPTPGVTYTIFFGTSAGSIGTVLASGVSSTNYAAMNLNISAMYYFTVEAVSANGNSPLSNTASATTQAAASTPAPSAPIAVAASSSQISLSWTGNATGQTFSVYSGTSTGAVANLVASGLAGTSYTVNGLNASTTYYFTIVASTSSAISSPSGVGSATTLASPVPAAPSGLSATAVSSSQINLSWTPGSTASVTYTVYRGGSAIGTGITATSFPATGLNASTTYSFTVVAVSASGTSTASNAASATTQAASVVTPAAPFGLSASPSSASQINLNWQPSTTSGVAYSVYLGTVSGATSTLVANGLTGQNYSVNGLFDNTSYFFTVKAVSSGGVSSAASNQAAATTQALPATPPAGLSASAVSATQINLSWSAVVNTGATYAVFYGTTSGAENTMLATGINGTTYSASGLTSSTTYFFIVRSVSAGGTSSPSTQASATTQAAGVPIVPVTPPTTPPPPASPSALFATASSSTQINLSWSPSSTAGVAYTIYSGSTAIANGIAGTSYSANGLTPGTAYTFTIVAVSSGGSSSPSNAASATTSAAPPPSAPTGLAATATSSSQINLSWTASVTAGVTYRLYSGPASGGESNLVASGITGTSYSATGLNASTAYFFIVKAAASGSAGASSSASNEATATTQSAAAGGCHVSYLNQSDWGAGFTGNLTIANTSSTAWTTWTVTWSYSGNQQVSTSWNGIYSQTGQQVSISNAAWDGSVAAGGMTSVIGWNANYSGTNDNPTRFYVNGLLCH